MTTKSLSGIGNKIKLSLILVSGVWILLLAIAPISYAQSTEQACRGLGGRWQGGECQIDGDTGDEAVIGLIRAALNMFSLLIGVAAVFMIMLGGFKYLTSGGDSSKVSSAQNTILYAIVGMVVAAMSQVIVRFVLGRI